MNLVAFWCHEKPKTPSATPPWNSQSSNCGANFWLSLPQHQHHDLVLNLSLSSGQSVVSNTNSAQSNETDTEDKGGPHFIIGLLQPCRVGFSQLGATLALNLFHFVDLCIGTNIRSNKLYILYHKMAKPPPSKRLVQQWMLLPYRDSW
jgi:hypothetical protein